MTTEQDTIKTQLDALHNTLEALRREIAELKRGNGIDLQAFKTPEREEDRPWLKTPEVMNKLEIGDRRTLYPILSKANIRKKKIGKTTYWNAFDLQQYLATSR